jgi:arsenate reductase (thioredoxin)
MTRVLFVCVENAGRSQIAQALYERRGGKARSAGSHPADELHEAVVEALEEVREFRAVIEQRVSSLPL